MDISSINSNSAQDLQSLQNLYSLLYPSGQNSAANTNALFSDVLQSAKKATTNNTQAADNMAMLQALQGYNTFNALDSLFQATGDSGTANNTGSIPGPTDSASNNDGLLAALEGANTGDSSGDSLLQQMFQTSGDSGDSAASFFNSDDAMMQAMTGAGMSLSQINQMLAALQTNTQYNQQGLANTGAGNASNLFSGIA